MLHRSSRPRCSCSHGTNLNVGQVVVLCLINLNESTHVNVIWAFAPFMMEDLGIESSQIGVFVGYLATSFFVAQLASSVLWGKLADTIGRRPTLLLGLAGTSLPMALLGLSKSTAFAIAMRGISGLLNGNIGVTKTYMGEITDRGNQARGFSMLAFIWGIGSILAPMVGGFLSRLAVKHPDTFAPDSIVGVYPYLLPCIFSSAISITGLIGGFFYLPETKAFIERRQLGRRGRGKYALVVPASGRGDASATGDSGSGDGEEHHNNDGDDDDDNDEDGERPVAVTVATVTAKAKAGRRSRRRYMKLKQSDPGPQRQQPAADINDPPPNPVLLSSSKVLLCYQLLCPRPRTRRPKTCCCADRAVVISVSLYGLLALLYIIFDELFSTFCQAPSPAASRLNISSSTTSTSSTTGNSSGNGSTGPAAPAAPPHLSEYPVGLSFTTDQVGTALSIGGAALLVYQGFFYSRVCDALGVARSFYWSCLFMVPLFLAFPAVAFLSFEASHVALWFGVGASVVLKNVLAATAFTSVMLMINEAATRWDAGSLGSVNGIAMSVSSAARALGPMLGGTLWFVSLNINAPGHQWLVYCIVAALAAACTCLVQQLPPDFLAYLQLSKEELEQSADLAASDDEANRAAMDDGGDDLGGDAATGALKHRT